MAIAIAIAQCIGGEVVDAQQRDGGERRRDRKGSLGAVGIVERTSLQHFLEALEFDIRASRKAIVELALNILGIGFPELHEDALNADGAWPTLKKGTGSSGSNNNRSKVEIGGGQQGS